MPRSSLDSACASAAARKSLMDRVGQGALAAAGLIAECAPSAVAAVAAAPPTSKVRRVSSVIQPLHRPPWGAPLWHATLHILMRPDVCLVTLNVRPVPKALELFSSLLRPGVIRSALNSRATIVSCRRASGR